jgi:nicotinamide riboside kinase
MRIGIDGTMSSGKTTLFEKLRRTTFAERFDFVPEASRVVAAEFGVRSQRDWEEVLSSPELLDAFLTREEQWLAANESEHCIVDSSFNLIQIYRKLFANDPFPACRDWPKYDLIFFCEATHAAESDGFRFLRGRADIDRLYRRHRKKFHVSEFIDLSPDTDRFAVAQQTIEGLLKTKQ